MCMHSSTYIQEIWLCFEQSFGKFAAVKLKLQCNKLAGLWTAVVLIYCENVFAVSVQVFVIWYFTFQICV